MNGLLLLAAMLLPVESTTSPAAAAASPRPAPAGTTFLLAAARLPSEPGVGTGPTITVWRDPVAVFVPDGLRTPVTEYPTGGDEVMDVTGALEARVFIKRFRGEGPGSEQLRIYFSVNDTDASNQDRIDFIFDAHHDHAVALDDDVLLRIERVQCALGACTAIRAVRGAGNAFDLLGGVPVSLTDGVVLASHTNQNEFAGPGNRWTGEFILRPADLGWGFFPPAIGVMVQVRSATAPNPQGTFPAGANTLQPQDWGDLRLRYPIDFALSLDFSGSMLALDGFTQNRWVRAKRAADLFVATLGLLRDDLFNDRVGVSQYSWTCGNQTLAGNLTGVVPGLASSSLQFIPVPPSGTTSFTSGNNSNPPGNNCTPIRQGLTFAIQNQLAFPGAAGEKRDRVVVLLSDGFHNIPAGAPPLNHVPFDPDVVFTQDQKDFVNAISVAFGPDGTAGTGLLGEVASAFAPLGSTASTYINAVTMNELLAAYLDVLEHPISPVRINVVDDDAPGTLTGQYTLAEPRRAVFIGVWNDPAQASNLTVQRDGDAPQPPGTIANTLIGYAAVSVTAPQSGTWRFVSGGTPPDHRFVFENLRVFARFLVEQRNYGTGEPILLRVALQDRDRPLLGAQVAVETAKPGEGLGTYLSTVQPDCSFADPGLPRDRSDPGAVGMAMRTAAAGAQAQTGDPPPGRYALAADHFARCGKSELDRDSLPGIQLRDDGTQGDSVAGDGVYTLVFTDTDTEGTYKFRIRVRGSTEDGLAFARTRTVSQYVRVVPTAAATSHNVQVGGVIDGTQSATIFWLPRDGFAGYVGPGFDHAFRVSVAGGTATGPVIDLANGWYAQPIGYPAGRPFPEVEIAMPGTGFVKVVEPRRGAWDFEIFGSMTDFDSPLVLDPQYGIGLRVSRRLLAALRGELEVGTTLPELVDDSVRMLQLLAGARLDLFTLPVAHDLVPFVSAGAGMVSFDEPAETVAAAHASAGFTLFLTPGFGLRAMGRSLWLDDVRGAGATTQNMQLTVGLVLRF